ncbi:MAG: hypothetical protein QG656_1370, partial [Candidatus Hydrogenedentes bacterium]|nr:hypothetical protein [Candidatus Hydrogenedentota bacterium]
MTPIVSRIATPNLFFDALLLAVAALASSATAGPGEQLAAGKFGRALDAARGPAIVMPRDPCGETPFTVECWVQLRSTTARNTILSSEPTGSGGHWTLFSVAGSGALGVTLPGHVPAEVRSERAIADGAWHHLALILEPARVRLCVDGREVATQALVRDAKKERRPGWLVLGGGAIDLPQAKCDGLIDEVRISRGVRIIDTMPTAAPNADAETVGLWHLDDFTAPGEFADASPLGSPAWLAAGRSMDEIDRLSFKA